MKTIFLWAAALILTLNTFANSSSHDAALTEQEIDARLKAIRLVAFDVDGTLTDGSMYYTAEGDVMMRFYVQDGMGFTLLHKAGIETALITSGNSSFVVERAKKLGIKHVYLGCKAKKKALEELSEKLGIKMQEIAYMGDDVNDETAMRAAGFSACPSNAVPVIKKAAHHICHMPGGQGAARELAEMILKAQNKPNSLPENW